MACLSKLAGGEELGGAAGAELEVGGWSLWPIPRSREGRWWSQEDIEAYHPRKFAWIRGTTRSSIPHWLQDAAVVVLALGPYVALLFGYEQILQEAQKRAGEVSGFTAIAIANVTLAVLTVPMIYALMKMRDMGAKIRRSIRC